MTEPTQALTVRDRLTAIKSYQPTQYQPQPQPQPQPAYTIESKPINHPSNAIVCPVCQQRLLPDEVQYHPHNTNYTQAHYVRSTVPNRYHVYVNNNTVIAIVEYNPNSRLYESVYYTYQHTSKTLAKALRTIEQDSLETGQNLQIGLDWS